MAYKNGREGNTYQARKAWNSFYPDDLIERNSGWVIHHIDENPDNNAKENLQKMTPREHTILHNTGRIPSEKQRAAVSAANKGHTRWLGKKHTDESRRKMSESQSGKKHHRFGKKQPPEVGKKIAKALKGKYPKGEHYLCGRKRSEETKQRISEGHRRRREAQWAKEAEEAECL